MDPLWPLLFSERGPPPASLTTMVSSVRHPSRAPIRTHLSWPSFPLPRSSLPRPSTARSHFKSSTARYMLVSQWRPPSELYILFPSLTRVSARRSTTLSTTRTQAQFQRPTTSLCQSSAHRQHQPSHRQSSLPSLMSLTTFEKYRDMSFSSTQPEGLSVLVRGGHLFNHSTRSLNLHHAVSRSHACSTQMADHRIQPPQSPPATPLHQYKPTHRESSLPPPPC